MTIQTYKILLGSMLGKGPKKAYRKAFFRIGTVWILAAAFGQLLIRYVPAGLLDLPHKVLIGTGTYIAQVAVLIALLGAFNLIRPRNDTFARILCTLPLQGSILVSLLMSPGFVLAIAALLLVGPLPLSMLVHSGVPYWLGLLCIILGTLSAFGIVYSVPRRWAYLHIMLTGGIVWVEYHLLTLMRKASASSTKATLAEVTLIVLTAVTILLVGRSKSVLLGDANRSKPQPKLRTTFLKSSCWFPKKICRSHVTKSGLWITACMSVVIAAACRSLGITDVGLLSGITALLAAAFASDIRLTSRQLRPWEIVGHKGTWRFYCLQLRTSLLLCGVITAPLLLFSLWATSGSQYLHTAIFASFLLLGCSAGISCGTIFSRQARSVTAQTCATLTALGVILLPQVSWLAKVETTEQCLLRASLALLLLSYAYIFEYKRNRYLWKKGRTHVLS